MSDNSLSWGRAPEPPKHRVPNRRILTAVAILVVAVVVVRITVDHLPEWNGSALPSQTDIRAVLDDYAYALNTHDLERFARTYDSTRPQLALCQEQLFELAARTGERVVGRYAVGRIERWGGYVRAYADDGRGWLRLYFRRDGDRWKLSEPLLSEIGQEHPTPFGAITVWSWDLDADVVEILGTATEPVRQFAVAQGGPAPEHPFEIRLAPIQSLGPRCGFAGLAITSSYTSTTRIVIRELRLGPQYDRVAAETLSVLKHEALHWIQREYSGSAMQAMPWWMVEGWPEARAQPNATTRIRSALCDTPTLTIADLSRGPGRSEKVEVVSREYTIAAAMVQTMDAQYGADAYWKLFAGFRQDPVTSRVFENAGLSEAGVFDATAAKTSKCG